MTLEFTKMHGCGNDYIYINCLENMLENPSELAKRLSDRHYGIGSDGLVMICTSELADCRMRMFNADGSEARMCGNAVRCVGKYMYDRVIKKERLSVETLSGIKYLDMQVENGVAVGATVDMGRAVFEKAAVPVIWDAEGCIAVPLNVGGRDFICNAVSTGSAHVVTFVEDAEAFPLELYGPLFENHDCFPDRVNAEFVTVVSDTELVMRVWERGSGETWACGTGACASVAAAVENGLCRSGAEVRVRLRGGDLFISYTREKLIMRGPAVTVCDGTVVI